jgi:hypothetical protein
MDGMLTTAVAYYVTASLATWCIDLIVTVARGPVMIDPILKLIVVAICLGMVLVGLVRHRWLLGA